jgi:hypothetical protein
MLQAADLREPKQMGTCLEDLGCELALFDNHPKEDEDQLLWQPL